MRRSNDKAALQASGRKGCQSWRTQTEVNTETIIKKETFTKTGKVDILALVLFYVYLLAFFGTFQKGGFPVKDMA